jgi:hypothetical protein
MKIKRPMIHIIQDEIVVEARENIVDDVLKIIKKCR